MIILVSDLCNKFPPKKCDLYMGGFFFFMVLFFFFFLVVRLILRKIRYFIRQFVVKLLMYQTVKIHKYKDFTPESHGGDVIVADSLKTSLQLRRDQTGRIYTSLIRFHLDLEEERKMYEDGGTFAVGDMYQYVQLLNSKLLVSLR